MSKHLFEKYGVGLVMTRSGLNGQQAAVFRRLLQERAKYAAEVDLVVPVVTTHDDYRVGVAVARTKRLLAPLAMGSHPTITTKVLEVEPLRELMPHLRSLDEVWCATVRNQSEAMVRPARVHALAQGDSTSAPRFKFLHYWVEVDPETLGGTDVRPKKRHAMKGW